MLSRCNFYAIARWNALGPHRPYVSSCTGCLAKFTSLGHRTNRSSHGYDRFTIAHELRLLQSYTCHIKRAMTTTSSTLPTPPPPIMDDKSQNIFQRFKNTFKKYWYIVLPVHLVTSTLWFGSFFFIASSGCDVPALLEMLGLPNWIVDKVRDGNSWTSYLVIAYGLYKIFTPLRYMVTLGGTGMTIRYLRRLGYSIDGPHKKP